MKTTSSFYGKLLIFSLIVLLVSNYSCKKKDDSPDIPPSDSFIMDFSAFSDAGDTTSKDIQTYQNWGHSFTNAAVWNFILTVTMAVPVVSFTEAFNHEPEWHRRDGGYWIWSYSFNVGATSHTAELTGDIDGDSVIWEMRIDDFLWYYGHSHINKTGGYWIINQNPDNPTPLLRIEWNNDLNGNADIKYENIVPEGAENGGYIFYGRTSSGEFDRFYNIYNKGQDNLTEIEWNSTDKHGRVKDPDKFGDSNWHCWDTDLSDIVCQ